MFGFLKRKKNDDVLSQMDGREVKYVTLRVKDDLGNVKEEILGKSGRIVVIDGIITVMCGERDVFKCIAENSEYFLLLDGSGITVSGVNLLNGQNQSIVVYYTYYRK